MKKTIAAVLAVILLTLTLASCGKKNTSGDNNGNISENEKKKISLRVWTSQEDQAHLKELIDAFQKTHTDKDWDVTVSVVGENDTKTEVLKDVSAAADVFSFASDQVAELKAAGALYRITKNKDNVVSRNTEASVKAATVDGELYGYPSSADTFFLYYDKSVFTEDEVKSVESIMKKDIGAGKKNFSMKIDDGWYSSSIFFAAGCTLFGADGTDPAKMDFNDANGVKAANYMIDLAANNKFACYDDAKIKAGFTDKTLGAAVSGTWNAEAIAEALGDNYAAAKLPTIKLDGQDKNLISMANYKLFGVNAHTAFPAEAMELADYLTDYDAQKARFEKRSYAPTNTTLAKDTGTLAQNPAVAALTMQTEHSRLQTSIAQVGNFWTPAEAFGTGILDKSITKANVQAKLNDFVKSVLAKITAEVK